MNAKALVNSFSSASVVSLAQIRNILVILFVLWALFSLSRLFWLLLTPADEGLAGQSLPGAAVLSAAAPQATVDIALFKSFDLFGDVSGSYEADTSAESVITDDELNADKTKLDLELLGTAYASDQAKALAVIVSKKKQDQYRVGDKLPVGVKVTLSKILTDRVIILNNGVYESLWLYDINQVSSTQTRTQPKPVAKPASRKIDRKASTEDFAALREMIYEDPAALSEIVRVAPVTRDGSILGYRVTPGSKSKLFRQVGFKANDVVTSINGIELNNPQGIVDVYQLLQDSTQASFVVLRGEDSIELDVSLEPGLD